MPAWAMLRWATTARPTQQARQMSSPTCTPRKTVQRESTLPSQPPRRHRWKWRGWRGLPLSGTSSSTSLHGWGVPSIARITTWPSRTPEEHRSVACRCYLHPGCGSSAKMRRMVPGFQLLEWAFSGERLLGASRAELKAAGERHTALSHEIMRRDAV